MRGRHGGDNDELCSVGSSWSVVGEHDSRPEGDVIGTYSLRLLPRALLEAIGHCTIEPAQTRG